MTDYAMKLPAKPPRVEPWDLFPSSGKGSSARLMDLALEAGNREFEHQRYDHWDTFRRRTPPAGLTVEQWWYGVRETRLAQRTPLPLRDAAGRPFGYTVVDAIVEAQHEIDLSLGGHLAVGEAVTNPDLRDRYIVSSLLQESITSSQIEGAVVTRDLAKEMLRTNRPPRDRSEQMILNNYRTMQWLRGLTNAELSRDLVFEIMRRMTQDTLDRPEAVGRFRTADESIVVADDYGSVAHVPPPADQLADRIAQMCDFANGKTPARFVHPLVRSIALHFWLAHDHPFVDGNGRTARALFYWSMLRHGYWLFEFISISQVILDSSRQYYRAFLHTESDDNDLTYFILYHVKVVRQAAERLRKYVALKAEQTRVVDGLLRASALLNHRQRALLSHALRHPGHAYTTESHRTSHGVVYQTARNDLLDLAQRGLLTIAKRGRTDYFTPPGDLEKRLRAMR